MIQLKINSYNKRDIFILLESLMQARAYLNRRYPDVKTQAHRDIYYAIRFLEEKLYNAPPVENSVETVET